MTNEEFNNTYNQYQVLNNCLATSYQMKDSASTQLMNDKNDIQAQMIIKNTQHDIDQLKGPVKSLWSNMLEHLQEKHNIKELQNPVYATKKKEEKSNLKIEK